MSASCITDVYSAREIARAAGVAEERVAATLGTRGRFVGHAEALRLGRMLTSKPSATVERSDAPLLFRLASGRAAAPGGLKGLPLAVSGTLHFGLAAAALGFAMIGQTTNAASVDQSRQPLGGVRLVFLTAPGPGGGGGGGGLRQKAPAPHALRRGTRALSSPLPVREPPPSVPAPDPQEPPPLEAEPLPAVTAPLITAPADNRDRAGVLEQARAEEASRGRGEGGGAGTGRGTGLGAGDGSGVGEGSGGGTGGGPYRPGSGVVPPRLLREVKAEYTDDARRRGLRGDTLLEIVVRRDGTVGDVKVLKALGGGLDERAIAAVRQWRFAPATRQGTPVDIVVEVAVEFMLR